MKGAVTIRGEGGAVRIDGALTLRTVQQALQAANGLFAQDGKALTFDLAGLRECDSAALALLLEWRRQARRHGRELTYRNIPERLAQLARISDIDKVLEFDVRVSS